MTEQQPVDLDAWPEVDAEVAILYGYDYHRAELTTVTRLTDRDVVLANGMRFRRASTIGPRRIKHTPRSRKVVDYRFLVPTDDEEVVKVQRREAAAELKRHAEAQAMASGAVACTINDTHNGEPISATWSQGDPRTI